MAGTLQQESGGYGIVPNWVRRAYGAKIGLAGLGLYAVLTQYAGGSGTCWPAVPTLADEMGCNHKTIRHTLAVLADCGLITIQRRRNQTSVITLENSQKTVIEGDNSQNTVIVKIENSQNLESQFPKNGNCINKVLKNNTEEEHILSVPASAEPVLVDTPDDQYPADFETWWAGWPKKDNKKGCARSYRAQKKRLGAGAADVLIRARGHYLASLSDPCYAIKPEKFLSVSNSYIDEWADRKEPTNGSSRTHQQVSRTGNRDTAYSRARPPAKFVGKDGTVYE